MTDNINEHPLGIFELLIFYGRKFSFSSSLLLTIFLSLKNQSHIKVVFDETIYKSTTLSIYENKLSALYN